MTPLRALRTLRRLHRRVLLHRRPLAALVAGAAVLAGLQAASPPPPPTVAVLTARHDLPGGTVLGDDDLARTRLAPGTVPAGSVRDLRDLRGRTLAAPVTRGEVLTAVRTLTPGVLAGYPGSAAVPVRVTDAAVVDLLRVGDRVTLVLADPDGRAEPVTLAAEVPVVAVPRAEGGALATGTPGRLVVVAVPTERAEEVAARAATGYLVVIW